LAPGGIMLISDKGTVHSDFWAGETLNTPSFHGNSLAHDVNFPLLLQWLTQRGLSGLLTPDSQAVLKTLLLCRQSVLPMPVAHAFGTHFCQRNRNLSTQARLAQGVSLIAQGQASEGIHILEQVLQIRPRDGHLIYRLACLYLLQGEPLKALAFKDRPHDSPLLADEFAYLWGESYYALEEYAQACQFYQPLAAKGFPKAQLQAHLQASLRALGRVSEDATQ
jgi:tetratricopeptide (TPR) repeat protein